MPMYFKISKNTKTWTAERQTKEASHTIAKKLHYTIKENCEYPFYQTTIWIITEVSPILLIRIKRFVFQNLSKNNFKYQNNLKCFMKAYYS